MQSTIDSTAQLIAADGAVSASVEHLQTSMTSFQQDISTAFNQMFQHVENMASHIIALEGAVSTLMQSGSVDLAKAEAWVKQRIAHGTDNKGEASEALDVLRNLASQGKA